jgi:excisionase family DNA binding protein
MSAFLNVQHAARRLGVSPVTIRRWTATGFLPCTRTAGGHRRIAVDDIEELARAIGGSSQLAARRARERELETIVETSVAVASEVDLQPLLAEIARRVTHLLDCDFCAVSSYDPEAGRVHALAEYDATGERLPDTEVYDLRQYPLTRKVLDEHTPALVNLDDPHADAAEVATLRSDGDRSLLMLPLVYRGQSIGLLEAIDARRARRYSRQELRLCQAVAGQAAVALHNTSLRAAARSGRDDLTALREALRDVAAPFSEALAEPDEQALLERLARSVCDVLGAVSCVVATPRRSAGAARPPGLDSESQATGSAGSNGASRPDGPNGAPRPDGSHDASQANEPDGQAGPPERPGSDGHVLVGREASGDCAITLTLPRAPSDGLAELLDLIAAVTAARAGVLSDGRRDPRERARDDPRLTLHAPAKAVDADPGQHDGEADHAAVDGPHGHVVDA